jgi:hypothetical protein
LYNQYNNAGSNATSSQDFEPANDPFDDELADDFVVPGGGNLWSITGVDVDGVYFNGTGPADSVHVRFYTNAGTLPGTLLREYLSLPYTGTGGDFVIALPQPMTLGPGTYWVSVQARQDFTPAGQWGWTDRTVQSNSEAAWRNPGGGFGICPDWQPRGSVCGIDPGVPDQVFLLRGTSAPPTSVDVSRFDGSADSTAARMEWLLLLAPLALLAAWAIARQRVRRRA